MLNRYKLPILYFADEGKGDDDKNKGKGGGGGGDRADDSRQRSGGNVAATIARHGGAENAVAALLRDLFNLREWKRKVLADPTEVLPKDSLLLNKADADEYHALKALGKSADIKKKLEQGEKDATSIAAHARHDTFREAATAEKLNAAVLIDLLDQRNVTVEIRKEKVSDKDVPVPYVKKQDGATVKLVDFIKSDLAQYEPALKAGSSQQDTNAGRQQDGIFFPPQGGTDGTPPATATEKFLADKQKRDSEYRNPLQPQKTT